MAAVEGLVQGWLALLADSVPAAVVAAQTPAGVTHTNSVDVSDGVAVIWYWPTGRPVVLVAVEEPVAGLRLREVDAPTGVAMRLTVVTPAFSFTLNVNG
jgi:hypothetical protein